jgi:protein-S-isoprenylcysteine O-methyltransferase Ste14
LQGEYRHYALAGQLRNLTIAAPLTFCFAQPAGCDSDATLPCPLAKDKQKEDNARTSPCVLLVRGQCTMTFEWIRTIIILPMNVLVFIPAIVLYCTGYRWTPNHPALLLLGAILLFGGLALAAWTMRLFAVKGKGTAAPWNPPTKLVVSGPYCYVRNPMITSVLTMLLAESLLLNTCWCFGLFALFWLGNMIYFPFFEEKDLEKRFGESYLEYKRNVPRWIPRLTPWQSEQ